MSAAFVSPSVQHWSSTQWLFSVSPGWELYRLPVSCPVVLRESLGSFNSQPIFCPSQHFIPTLELSSGPHSVTFLTYPTACTSSLPKKKKENKEKIKILSTPPCLQAVLNMYNKSHFQTGCGSRASCQPLHTSHILIWLPFAAYGSKKDELLTNNSRFCQPRTPLGNQGTSAVPWNWPTGGTVGW